MDSFQSQAAAPEQQHPGSIIHPFLRLQGDGASWATVTSPTTGILERVKGLPGPIRGSWGCLHLPGSLPVRLMLRPGTTCRVLHRRVPLARVGDMLDPSPAGEAAGAGLHARHASGGYYRYNLNAVTSCAEGIKY